MRLVIFKLEKNPNDVTNQHWLCDKTSKDVFNKQLEIMDSKKM